MAVTRGMTRGRRLPAGFWSGAGRRGRVRPARRPVRVRPVRGVTARRIAPVVKRIISRQEETKCCGFTIENAVSHNAIISNADAVALLPVVAQGTGSSERVGDKVKGLYLKVKGCLSYYDRGQAAVQSPMIVKIFCLRQKGLGNLQTALASVNLPNFLDNGGATNSWDGSTLRAMWRVNTDLFDVLASRTIKISDTDVENHKAQTGHYSMSIKVPSTMKWSPGNQYPDNFAPFFVLGWYYEDGSTPSAMDVNIINTAYGFLYYKDA